MNYDETMKHYGHLLKDLGTPLNVKVLGEDSLGPRAHEVCRVARDFIVDFVARESALAGWDPALELDEYLQGVVERALSLAGYSALVDVDLSEARGELHLQARVWQPAD